MRARFLHDFFIQRSHRSPERVAVDIPPGRGRPARARLTYGELATRSIEIAFRLERHIHGECVVILMLPRTSVEAYAAQIAVLRSGAAYTAIDPSWPDARVREVVADSNASAVITDESGWRHARTLGVEPVRIINVDASTGGDHATTELRSPSPRLTEEALAYLIYTSGTTGRPKGVMVEHHAIVNLIGGDLAEFALSESARVGHGSSHAYDSSLEEIWLAWAAGGTVVVLDDDVVRAGPDLVDWLARERVTVLCPPPTLLRTMGGREAAARLPELTLIYAGGEALPEDVAAVWSAGRRLVNGYGPTECTVTALRADIRQGEEITIGRPIPGLHAWVLDAALHEASEGELCIGGIGLARGYWNAPDLTAAKFLHHPRLGRIYRTGDLVRRNADGVFSHHGRIDAQIKLRGYRIELEEIEAYLARCEGVRAAACRVDATETRQTLVALVVPSDPISPPSSYELRAALRLALPAHMIPGQIQLVAALPTTTGGKLDRSALQHIEVTDLSIRAFVAAEGEIESRIEGALRTVLRRTGPLSTADDFFLDLEGDSLRAAELVTELRRDPTTESITVRDVYEAPTIRGMAERANRPAEHREVAEDRPARDLGRPLVATAIQTLWIAAECSLAAVVSYLAVLDWLPRFMLALGLIPFLLSIPILIVAATATYAVAALAAVVLIKRALIGKYVPTEAPVWGGFHIRHWVVQQTARLVPWRLIAGGEFHSVALRALGARIGRRVHIHRGVDLAQGAWDLLEIGDDVSIGQDAELRLVELDAGRIVVGPIVLGNGVTIETRAGVGENTRMEDRAYLAAHSSLASGQIVPSGQRWDGIPAAPAGRSPEVSGENGSQSAVTPLQYSVALLAADSARAIVQAMPIVVAAATVIAFQGASAEGVAAWVASPNWHTSSLLTIAGLTVAAGPLRLAWQALLCRTMGRVPRGVIHRWSLEYLRVWIKADVVESAGHWLSGTLMWPVWLRASGMTVGPDCEISTIIDVVPEQITIGRTCFLADGVYLGGPLVHRGCVTIAPTRLEDDVFLGNHAVIPAGATIGTGVLIGILTVADARAAIGGTSWFGHPPFELGRRPAEGQDRRLTHEPGAVRYLNRLFWELLRFTIPLSAWAVLFGWIAAIDLGGTALFAPLFTIVAAAGLCLFVLTLKWILLGRVVPGEHPLWSCWCSRWDYLYVAWTQLARPVLTIFEGTLLLNWYLRAMGARIGRRVVLGGGFAQMVDPDMLQIEDEATVHALFQAHTFEDRILKIDRITIGCRATVASAVVLLYGADVGADASVAAHSAVMKRERLTPGRSYVGCPTREASRQVRGGPDALHSGPHRRG